MLNIDDVIKLLLGGAFSFAIVVVSWQVARFLAALTSNLKAIKTLIDTAQRLADQAVDDYESIRDLVKKISGLLVLPAAIKKVSAIFNRGNKYSTREEDSEVE